MRLLFIVLFLLTGYHSLTSYIPFSCTPKTTHSIVKEYWDNGDSKVEVGYSGKKAVYISEFYLGKRLKLEIYYCNGLYKGAWNNGEEIVSGIAELKLAIRTLESQYETSKDPNVLDNLNEHKRELIFHNEMKNSRWKEHREQYARDIYEYYKLIGDDETVTYLREIMYPMGYYKYDGYVGDERYLTYPYDLSRLSREQVIIQTNKNDRIYKIYWYDDNGLLRRIYSPQKNSILFIEEYGLDGSYALMSGSNTIAIYGGTFDDFNTTYRGGAGWSDMSVEYEYLTRAIQTTENSIVHLEKNVEKYRDQTGTPLTEDQFLQSVNIEHPLMIIEEMNLAYFFDGHGQRVTFTRTSSTEFHISSTKLTEDKALLAEYDRQFAELGKDINKGILIFFGIVIGIPVLAVAVIVIRVIYFVRYRV